MASDSLPDTRDVPAALAQSLPTSLAAQLWGSGERGPQALTLQATWAGLEWELATTHHPKRSPWCPLG